MQNNVDLFTEPLYAVLNAACQFYYDKLRDPSSEASKNALGYITDRGFERGYIDAYALGYAPKEPDSLYKHLINEYPVSVIREAGLCYSGPGGNLDAFRDRLMFPIFDQNSNVVGFGGRSMSKNPDDPKYINSRETAVYKKSNILYGYHIAKNSIKPNDFTMIVEGYTDLLALHQNKIYNSIASCGTAFSDEQISLITRETNHFVLVFDSDKAGIDASIRLSESLIPRGIKFGFVLLPDGEDPCSFILSHDRYSFMKKVYKRVSFVDFIISAAKNSGRFKNSADQSETIEKILKLIALSRLPDNTSFFLDQLSSRVKLDLAVLKKQMYSYR